MAFASDKLQDIIDKDCLDRMRLDGSPVDAAENESQVKVSGLVIGLVIKKTLKIGPLKVLILQQINILILVVSS